jgi:hypothetical protein
MFQINSGKTNSKNKDVEVINSRREEQEKWETNTSTHTLR